MVQKGPVSFGISNKMYLAPDERAGGLPWVLLSCSRVLPRIKIKKKGLPKTFNEFNYIKSIGFSDKKLSELTNTSESLIRKKRTALKVLPVYKKVDTCAAEFKSFTPYMYSTYQRHFSSYVECESDPSNKNKIIILGGGPNRIGHGQFYLDLHPVL